MPQTQPQDTSSPPAKSTFMQNSQPELVVDNTIHDDEQMIAETIIQSKQPVIVITNKAAKSMAVMGKYMSDTFPHTPIVFETQSAQQDFFNNSGINRNDVTPQCVGHFQKSADEYSRTIGIELCDELQQSDCIIVFGSPDQYLKKELSHHGDKVFVNETNHPATSPRINMAIIGRMERPVDQWKSWKQRMQNSHSIC
jgi:hypothetical protein